MDHNASQPASLIRLPSVLARTGMGRSWIYKEIAAGRFPSQVKIGRASGWDSSAVDAWLAKALSQSTAANSIGGH